MQVTILFAISVYMFIALVFASSCDNRNEELYSMTYAEASWAIFFLGLFWPVSLVSNWFAGGRRSV